MLATGPISAEGNTGSGVEQVGGVATREAHSIRSSTEIHLSFRIRVPPTRMSMRAAALIHNHARRNNGPL